MESKDKRWSWREVDINAIRHNINEVKKILNRNTKLLAVVKANAYGHGAVEVAKTAIKCGATYLGVATVDEAIELREAGITTNILILSQPPETSVEALVEYDIMPSIYTPEFAIKYAEYADSKSKIAPFHLVVNTGMNRIGVRYNEVLNFMKLISFHRALSLEGTFTHFATADCSETLDYNRQFKNFTETIDEMKNTGYNPGIVHCANSAAQIKYPETHFDMVRLGISMYGCHPCDETRELINLQEAMSIHARITDERILGVGEGVSYEMNYRARGAVKICTIPVGYADGLRRAFSSKIDVIYRGLKFPQVGNICMDQCMFEIDMNSGFAQQNLDAQIGEEVVLLGKQGDAFISIEELAAIAGTNTYEILCGFSHRMPVYYK